MLSGLVAALALGFLGGPAEGGKAVTEVRLSYRCLIVGTWERWLDDGTVVAWDFSRNGRIVVTVLEPDGNHWTNRGTYRIHGNRLEANCVGGPATLELVQLDNRRFIYSVVVNVKGVERRWGCIRFSRRP
jgi:hypothetical protein